MKVSSISGTTYHVKDLARTSAFYESLGFRRGKEEQDRVTFYVNWFFVRFVAGGPSAGTKTKAAGLGTAMHIKVDDLDAFHKDLLANGLEPEGEPEVGAAGIREVVLRDPDGYRLAFFDKK
jgi:catechol 2,3-dioxygenase-like lactoylglutathione lyase family enzyme